MANATSSTPMRSMNTRHLLTCLMSLRLRSTRSSSRFILRLRSRLRFPQRRRPHLQISRSEIAPGDHIYTPRAGGVYDHHGIYIGEGRVIHFQNSLDDKALGSGSSIPRYGPCRVCEHHSGRSGVVESCLNCFLRSGIIYRYEYGYRGPSIQIYWITYMLLHLMRWCTSADSDPRNTVIDRAKLLLTDGFGEYNLVTNNCEDFALFCKTGQHIRSGQIMFPVIWELATLMLVSFIYIWPLLLIPGVGGFAAFDALRRKKWYLFYIRDPRRMWNLPRCKRYLGKWKKRTTAGGISQPVSPQ